MLSGTQDGGLESWVSTDGSTYEATAGGPAVGGFASVMGAAVRDDIWLAVGTDYERFLPIVWMSSDGREWQRATTTGLERRGDMSSIVATERGFVATGAYRTGADPGSGPFVPALWRSVDGAVWEEIELPAKGEGFALGVVAMGDRLLVAGGSGPNAVVWRSDDQGSSWSRTRPAPLRKAGPSHITSMAVAADGESVVLMGGSFDEGRGGAPLVLVSDDRGETWESVSLDAALWEGVFGGGVINGTAHGLVFVAHRSFGPFTDTDRCYADPEGCGSSSAVALHSVEGRTWGELDLAGVDQSGYFQLHSFARDHLGALLLLGAREQLELHRWTGLAPPPILPPPAPPPISDIPLAMHNAQLEPGVTYRYPLNTHCGMDLLGGFNEQWWYRVDPPGGAADTGSGRRLPDHWPTAGQSILGLITLTAGNTIEYSIPGGEVIAVYEPSDELPPGCA